MIEIEIKIKIVANSFFIWNQSTFDV